MSGDWVPRHRSSKARDGRYLSPVGCPVLLVIYMLAWHKLSLPRRKL
jgi:hypothetical protein